VNSYRASIILTLLVSVFCIQVGVDDNGRVVEVVRSKEKQHVGT
jgi:hypothetical protein